MNFLLRLLAGKRAALALEILNDVLVLFDSLRGGGYPSVGPLARRLFQMVPAEFKAPVGPATEQEFIDAIASVAFVLTRQKSS